MVWKNESLELDISQYGPDISFLVESAIECCIENAHSQMTIPLLIAPLFVVTETDAAYKELEPGLQKNWRECARLIQRNLKPGVSMPLCAQAISTSAGQTKDDINPYERAYWQDEAADALESLPDSGTLRMLLVALVRALIDKNDFETELFQDLMDLAGTMNALASIREAVAVFDSDGAVCDGALSQSACILLDNTVKAAAESGHNEALLIHVLYAMLEDRDGYLWQVMRQITPPVQELPAARAKLRALFTSPSAVPLTKPALVRSSLHPSLADILVNAADAASGLGQSAADDRQILLEIMRSGDAGTKNVLVNVLQWPVEDVIRIAEKTNWDPLYVRLPVELCECRNLSLESAALPYAPRPEVVAGIVKILYRKDCRNAALFGERGVGKTTAAWLLAEELRNGKSALLQIAPVVYMDLHSIPDDQLENRVSPIFTYMEEHPRSIYILDGFGLILAAATGVCMRRLSKNAYRLVAILDRDAKMLLDGQETATPVFRMVEVEEPKKELVKDMIAARIPQIEAEFDVRFENNLDNFSIRLSGDYILSRRFPQKAISLLESAAADAAAEAALAGGGTPAVGRKELAAQIAAETGLPVETILGTGQDKDYAYLLSRNLVGQEHAVAKVANRMDLIQKGFVDKNRPAAIFMFSGLSGTGKTELAKQIASVYSSSHKIITYAMADFKDSSSVSRLIGSAPGLIGYDEGGMLINHINRDPYSLILFDEVEKAHPAVWDPLLNLFDEGMITDTRGTVAYANKTFFVLTSNIGQYDIVRMMRENRPLAEIEETVRQAVGEATYARTSEKCFRPEFIGRITRSGGIVIFNALSLEAMEGITRHLANKEAAQFSEMRECKLEIDDEVIQTIARRAFDDNDIAIQRQQGLYFGGRRINALFDELVLNRLAENIRQTSNAPLVRIIMDGDKTAIVPVTDEADADALLKRRRETTIARVIERLDRIALTDPAAIRALPDERLARLDAILAEAGIMSGV